MHLLVVTDRSSAALRTSSRRHWQPEAIDRSTLTRTNTMPAVRVSASGRSDASNASAVTNPYAAVDSTTHSSQSQAFTRTNTSPVTTTVASNPYPNGGASAASIYA